MQLNSKQISKIYSKINLVNGKLIVMIDVMGDKKLSVPEQNSNIYCVDKQYNVIWQVRETKTKLSYEDDGFVYLKQNEKGEIIADRFSGFVYKIDPETGEATRIGFHK